MLNYTHSSDNSNEFNWTEFRNDTGGTEYGYSYPSTPNYPNHPNYPNYPSPPYTPLYPWDWKPEIHKVKRIIQTIEKYDKHGNYKGKEVVTEEEEIYDKEVWGSEMTFEYNVQCGGIDYKVSSRSENSGNSGNFSCCVN